MKLGRHLCHLLLRRSGAPRRHGRRGLHDHLGLDEDAGGAAAASPAVQRALRGQRLLARADITVGLLRDRAQTEVRVVAARRRPRSREYGNWCSCRGGGGRSGGVAADANSSVCGARSPSSSRWQLAAFSSAGGALWSWWSDGVAAVRRDDLGGRPEEGEEDGKEHEAVEEAENDERGENEEEISENRKREINWRLVLSVAVQAGNMLSLIDGDKYRSIKPQQNVGLWAIVGPYILYWCPFSPIRSRASPH